MSSNKNNQGFTLIELVIALAVFTIGISAALSLALANYNNSRDNLDKIIAANLAREGIELIKNVRDSNWLRIEANETCGGIPCTWDYSLTVNNQYVYIDYNDSWPLSFGATCAAGITDCVTACLECDLYKDVDNYYVHEVPVSGTLELTNYSRAIFLEKICIDEMGINPQNTEDIIGMDLPCDAGDTYAGIQITSHVQWEDGGTKSLEIIDQIYNWRR
ncbi:MAG: prepilin-type N-terminal cleavage/methylation domain-containing protein [Candidatus Komeilibacteria bacterium]|mgnify:CR=1 FL=1|nr:prepilin-type N-terminal cleavage/methylation domain-containing protein [Candidatus Komeilibacteria bacterium]MBT4447940.1 prepilin-type N-terminal cleavage/methylation domain-containing protein [Candidatus Komeilibacteria bacterium]